MSQWTPTAMAKEPERERAHSSCSTIVVRRSAPLPPYFSSYSTPRNPSSPRRGQIARGIRPAASHSSTCGMISRSMNCRIRSEEHTSELQSHHDLVCRLLLEKKNKHQT